MGSILSRTPFAILGAFGLLSLASGSLQWQQNIGDWLQAFQFFSRNLWQFLLGWFWEVIGWKLTNWAKDYFTMGLIVLGMEVRATMSFRKSYMIEFELTDGSSAHGLTVSGYVETDHMHPKNIIFRLLLAFFLWPASIALKIFHSWHYSRINFGDRVLGDEQSRNRVNAAFGRVMTEERNVYFETISWAGLIIVINYGLLIGNGGGV